MRADARRASFHEQLQRIAQQRYWSPTPGALPIDWVEDLGFAEGLARLQFEANPVFTQRLRGRLRQQLDSRPVAACRTLPFLRSNLRPARALVTICCAFLALYLLVHTPVVWAVQRWLGYGYIPEAGFIRLSETFLLAGPVVHEREDVRVVARQGYGNAEHTSLWLSLEGPARSWEDVLETAVLQAGETAFLDAQSWSKDGLKPNRYVLVFEPLPKDTAQAVLHLSPDWQMPLDWIPSDQAGLAPTAVTIPQARHTPTGQALELPCLSTGDVRVCIQAATVDDAGTHLLVEWAEHEEDNKLAPFAGHELSLVDPVGRRYRLLSVGPAGDHSVGLTFEPVPLEVRTLSLSVGSGGAEEKPGLEFCLPAPAPSFAPTPKAVPAQPLPMPTPTPLAESSTGTSQ